VQTVGNLKRGEIVKRQLLLPVLLIVVWLGSLALVVAEEPAEEIGAPLRLNLQKAIELAVAHNEQILIADEGITEAQGAFQSYAADAFPQINGSVSYTRNIDRMYQIQDMSMLNPLFAQFGLPPLGQEKIYFNFSHEWDFRITATQYLFTFGRLSYALSLGDITTHLAREGREIAVQDVILATKKSFFTVLFAKEALAVTKANLARIEEQRDTVKAKVAQGLMSRFDLLVVESEVAGARPRVLEAENNVLLSTQALLNVIGEALNRQVTLDGQLAFEPLTENPSELIAASLRARPEIRALQLQEDLYETTYRLSRANYFPILSANASVSRTGGSDAHIWPDDPWDELQPTLAVGVQLYVPLFDGFRNYGQMRQMAAKKRAAQLQRQQLARGIEMQVTALVSQIRLQEQIYHANQEAVNVAQEAYKLAVLRFESGLSARLEVTDARTNLNNAQLGSIGALFALNSARAELDRALGR